MLTVIDINVQVMSIIMDHTVLIGPAMIHLANEIQIITIAKNAISHQDVFASQALSDPVVNACMPRSVKVNWNKMRTTKNKILRLIGDL